MSGENWNCPAHGAYGDGVPDRYSYTDRCPQCGKEAHEAENAWRAEHARHAWWVRHSGVPARYRSATPEQIRPATASAKALRAAVCAYTADLGATYHEGRGLVLLGPPGLGKTFAAAATINVACRLWRGSIYCSWPDVVARIKAAFAGPRDDPDRQLIDRLIEAPLLAIDELGVKAATEWEHNELFRLVDARYSDCLPTIACSNASAETWPAAVGERIADRLRECGPVLALSGESQRGRLACTGPDAMTRPPAELLTRVHSRGQWIEQAHKID